MPNLCKEKLLSKTKSSKELGAFPTRCLHFRVLLLKRLAVTCPHTFYFNFLCNISEDLDKSWLDSIELQPSLELILIITESTR